MRDFMNILLESGSPTKTATPTDLDSLHPDIGMGGDLSTIDEPAPQGARSIELKTATSADTRRAAANARFAGTAPADELADFATAVHGTDEQDIISDEEAMRNAGYHHDTDFDDLEPRTPENLPAVISTAIEITDGDFDPTWHQVSHLPGYMLNGIRVLGRKVFSQFTNVAIEDIQTMCTMLDPEVDVRRMASWINEHGHKIDEMDFNFSEHIKCETKLYTAEGYDFLLVKDFGGVYIYGWPSENRQLSHDPTEAPRQIEG